MRHAESGRAGFVAERLWTFAVHIAEACMSTHPGLGKSRARAHSLLRVGWSGCIQLSLGQCFYVLRSFIAVLISGFSSRHSLFTQALIFRSSIWNRDSETASKGALFAPYPLNQQSNASSIQLCGIG